MNNTATRLITLIFLLQNQPNQKASELAGKLGVSLRTVHRYFEMLDEMGIPIYAERGPYGGFSLVRGYKMPPLVFTLEEAVALVLGTGMVEELWGQLYRESARGALAKLENLLPEEQFREVAWARQSLVATGLHRGDLDALAPTLEKLRRALREHRKVTMNYRSTTNPHPESRDFNPYALVHRWGWWYTIGYCHLRNELRTFRVDRIESLNLTDQVFQIAADFNIQEYLEQELKSQPLIQIRLRFDPEGVNIAQQSRAFWESMEVQADGAIIVTMKMPDLYWAASTILSYGPLVTVLEPEALRQMVAQWSQAVNEKYITKDSTHETNNR